MKRIYVIGCGTGESSISLQAKEIIDSAEIIIGSKRLTDRVNDKIVYNSYDPKEIRTFIELQQSNSIAILVSGDTGFFSLAAGINEEFVDFDVKFIPGISSINSFFAKLKLKWQGTYFTSAHGRNTNIVDIVRRNNNTCILCGRNTKYLISKLYDAGFEGLAISIGSNLDMSDEKLISFNLDNVMVKTSDNEEIDIIDKSDGAAIEIEESNLIIMLVTNQYYDDRARTGIDDGEFTRGESPMTKSEVRAVVMSRLGLNNSDICYDIGAGTGSVTVEMAYSAWNGKVYAIEKNTNAIDLIGKNLRKFKIGNTIIVSGKAPDVLAGLEPPDAVFIGGSDGNIQEIVECILRKNNKVRIVATAIAIETIYKLIESFKKNDIIYDICNLSVSKGKKAGDINMMIASNPIYIISGHREE